MLGEVIARIEARVPALTGRVQGAAELAALLRSNTLRDARGGAYVVPLSLRGGAARAATAAFVQDFDEVVAVVLVVPSGAPTGTRALGSVDVLSEAVLEALAGWKPDGAIGPLRLARAGMLNVGAGVLVYQIDFNVARQLRIAP